VGWFSEQEMFGNDRQRKLAAKAIRDSAIVARNAGLFALVVLAALAAAPAQAQVVCTTSGLDQSCVNTGASISALRSQTANGGNASGNNSGTIIGTTLDNVGGTDSILILTQRGGNASGINSGSLPVAGFAVFTQNSTLGPNGDATGTNTVTGNVATFFHVETGTQNLGTGGTATGTNAGSVGQFFQVDTLTGGNAIGTNSGTVSQFFQVTTATGGNATGNNSGSVGQNFLVNAAAGGNVSGSNSGSVATSFVVSTGVSLNGNAMGTNASTGTVGSDFQVATGSGEVNAVNAGRVGGTFTVQEFNSGITHLVTAQSSGSIAGDFKVSNQSGGDTLATNTGSVGGAIGFRVTSNGGNTTASNAGSIAQAFNVTNNNGAPGTLTVSNSGTIGAAFVINNTGGGATVTNSGTVGGGVRATAGNGGAISFTNSGTILGGGGDAIRFGGGTNNTLTLLQGSSITGNIVTAVAGDTLNFLLGPSTFTYGAASGFSGFNQVNVNSGMVILNGTNSANNIQVNGGNLQVGDAADPAATLAGAVNVAGGTLSGHGTVVGNVSVGNGATLAPGGSVGTLTIQGNLVLATAANYLVEISAATSSSTAVSGTATLGGNVQVFSANNSYRFNSPYTILTSAGLGGTQFSGLTPLAGTTDTLSYAGNSVQLTLTSALGRMAGLNLNQHAVATALDAAFNAGGGTGGLGAIFNGNIPSNLTHASGETATGSQQTTFDAMGLFMGLLTDPFTSRTGRAGSTSAAAGYADEALGYATTEKNDAFAMFSKARPTFEQRWSVWTAGFGGSQSTDGNTALGSNNTTSNIAGTAVGADYLISPNTLAGFALAGGGTSFSVANGGTGRSDLFQFGAYVRHTNGPAYLAAALAYGWQDVTTNRAVTIAGLDQLRAEFNANAYSGRLEGGYRFVSPATLGAGITPYAAAQFVTFDLPAYMEQVVSGTNNFALGYSAKDVTDVRSELGIRTDKSWLVNDGILTLRGRFAWAHDFDPDRSIAATFQSLPSASFVVNGAAQAVDSALTTASVEMKWKSGWSAAATFEGEFSNVTQSYAGKGVVRYQW
jgi:uncharacterized protein with beta-barrel porin domain